MTSIESKARSFLERLRSMPGEPAPGARLLGSIVAEVVDQGRSRASLDYNERYIEGGQRWGEHIDYHDGGRHAQTYHDRAQ